MRAEEERVQKERESRLQKKEEERLQGVLAEAHMSTNEDDRLRRSVERMNKALEGSGITGVEAPDEEDDSMTDDTTDDLPNNYDARTGRETKRETK